MFFLSDNCNRMAPRMIVPVLETATAFICREDFVYFYGSRLMLRPLLTVTKSSIGIQLVE
jgi:hypothetical protein